MDGTIINMKHKQKISIVIFLSLLFLAARLAFAETDKFSLEANQILDAPDFVSIDFLTLTSSSNKKFFGLYSVFYRDSERDPSVSPATLEQLLNAIELNDIDKAERLIIGLDINSQNKRGITPLYKSVFHNRFNFINLLLERGANTNIPDHEGLSPLHIVALENLDKLTSILLDHDAEIEAKDSFGYTPLHLAADQNNIETASNLIKRGA